jgi:endonuclease-3
MTPRQRSALFRRLQQANPRPTTELIYRTPFELLISVILSAQATDVSVNKATAGLFKVANTPAAILALGESGLKQHIRTIGLFNTKASNILRTCQALLHQHGGEVPRDRDALEALPGVGRKTANVVLNTAFGEPTIAGKTPRAVEDGLVATTPARFRRDAHHWLILHGRYICKARQPDCPHCPIAKQCDYPNKTLAP